MAARATTADRAMKRGAATSRDPESESRRPIVFSMNRAAAHPDLSNGLSNPSEHTPGRRISTMTTIPRLVRTREWPMAPAPLPTGSEPRVSPAAGVAAVDAVVAAAAEAGNGPANGQHSSRPTATPRGRSAWAVAGLTISPI